MIALLDNRDSFVFNLARYFEELGHAVHVLDSHDTTLDEITRLKPSALVISPGPCTPREAGISMQAVRGFSGRFPILGVCLGHQVIAEVFGWTTARSKAPTHGAAADITHDGDGLFDALPAPLSVGLYHSLTSVPAGDPAPLKVTARAPCGEVMALKHVSLPIRGVQFHPESVLTEHGHTLLSNFLTLCKAPA